MVRILYEKEEMKCFCTYNRSENVYDGKCISPFFQNKDFIMMNLTKPPLSLKHTKKTHQRIEANKKALLIKSEH